MTRLDFFELFWILWRVKKNKIKSCTYVAFFAVFCSFMCLGLLVLFNIYRDCLWFNMFLNNNRASLYVRTISCFDNSTLIKNLIDKRELSFDFFSRSLIFILFKCTFLFSSLSWVLKVHVSYFSNLSHHIMCFPPLWSWDILRYSQILSL